MSSQKRSEDRIIYASDLIDAEWNILEQYIPTAKSNKRKGGRPEEYSKREIMNGILYVKTTGCQWKLLPHDLPPWPIVYYYFNRWSKNGTWKRINKKLRIMVREKEGKNADPSVGIIDSQTSKTTHISRETGYDAGKKTVGRKRHILTDTLGLLLDVIVHPANIQDRDGGRLLIKRARTTVEKLEKIFADAGYRGAFVDWVKDNYETAVEIIKRNELHKFVLLPKRWIVERTLSWISKARRLSKEYETTTKNEESMIYISMIHLMVKRVI